MRPPILLDTCALIFMVEGDLSAAAGRVLAEATASDRTILASPVSAWEIGQLVARGRIRISADPAAWFARAASLPGIAVSRLPTDVLVASSFLPGTAPRDPVDRIMIACARATGAALMTRDRLILAYGAEGHVATIGC
ncbi:MAG: type II toxin-antitoxin system VapC family toxin [Bauldia sp.]|nr:type II toxin-antitoxin system VapC family toxin [Bauldia sp.]